MRAGVPRAFSKRRARNSGDGLQAPGRQQRTSSHKRPFKASNGQYFRVAQGALLCGATTALLSVLCQSSCPVLCSGGPCMLCCAARPLVLPCSMTCAPTSRACICPAPHQGCQCTCSTHTVRSSGFCFLGYQGGGGSHLASGFMR